MLKKSIIFMMLLLFSIEDVRKKRIDILPLLAFSVIGAIYQTVTRALTIPKSVEVCCWEWDCSELLR